MYKCNSEESSCEMPYGEIAGHRMCIRCPKVMLKNRAIAPFKWHITWANTITLHEHTILSFFRNTQHLCTCQRVEVCGTLSSVRYRMDGNVALWTAVQCILKDKLQLVSQSQSRLLQPVFLLQRPVPESAQPMIYQELDLYSHQHQSSVLEQKEVPDFVTFCFVGFRHPQAKANRCDSKQ